MTKVYILENKEIKKLGFDPYLLRESYTGGSKADTFIKKIDSKFREFLEIKETDSRLLRQFHRSLEQAPCVYLHSSVALKDYEIKTLKDEANNIESELLVILNNNGKLILLKNKTT